MKENIENIKALLEDAEANASFALIQIGRAKQAISEAEKAPRLLAVDGWGIAVRTGFERDGKWSLYLDKAYPVRASAIETFNEIWKGDSSKRTFAKCRKAGVAKAVRVTITAEVPE